MPEETNSLQSLWVCLRINLCQADATGGRLVLTQVTEGICAVILIEALLVVPKISNAWNLDSDSRCPLLPHTQMRSLGMCFKYMQPPMNSGHYRTVAPLPPLLDGLWWSGSAAKNKSPQWHSPSKQNVVLLWAQRVPDETTPWFRGWHNFDRMLLMIHVCLHYCQPCTWELFLFHDPLLEMLYNSFCLDMAYQRKCVYRTPAIEIDGGRLTHGTSRLNITLSRNSLGGVSYGTRFPEGSRLRLVPTSRVTRKNLGSVYGLRMVPTSQFQEKVWEVFRMEGGFLKVLA